MLATDPPDTLEIRGAAAFRDLLETGDMLVAVHYNIDYSITGEPSDTARDLFLIRLMEGADELGVVTPYPFYNDGYDQGIAALYWSAADAPAWEGTYMVRIQGNPAAFASPPSVSQALSTWSGVEGQGPNQQALHDWMVSAIQSLESNWSVTLLEASDSGYIVNATGHAYITGAIPGIQQLCPSLFWIAQQTMDTSTREWGTAQADLYAARFDDTWVGNGLGATADLLHVSPQFLGGMLFVLVPFIAAIIFSEKVFFTSTPALILLPLLMGMAALMGFFSMAVLALAVICFVLLIGYVLFFRTS